MGTLTSCLGLLLLLLIQISSSAATSHIVGGDAGWTTPVVDGATYSKWAAHQTFQVGDVLVFQFRAGHSVTEVSKSQFENCDGTAPISTVTEGPVSVTLKSPGDHFYICNMPGHCKYGQKLAITVAGGGGPSPLPSAASPSNHSAVVPAAEAAPPPATSASTNESAAATPPPSPTSAGAGGGAGSVLPLLHVLAVLLL